MRGHFLFQLTSYFHYQKVMLAFIGVPTKDLEMLNFVKLESPDHLKIMWLST